MGGARRSLGVTSRMDDAEWRRMLDVHLFGTFAVHARGAPPSWRSGAGRDRQHGLGGGLPHSGLGALRRRQGRDHRLHQVGGGRSGGANIRVNAIAPGLIDTPMTADIRRRFARWCSCARPSAGTGVPEDIAAVALFLVSDEASFVTGQVVSPNGGFYT